MRKIAAALTTAILAFSIPPASAGENCKCRYNGTYVNEGDTICMKTPSGGSKLARCEMVLNNTSWKMLEDGCPLAASEPPKIAPYYTTVTGSDGKPTILERWPVRSGHSRQAALR